MLHLLYRPIVVIDVRRVSNYIQIDLGFFTTKINKRSHVKNYY